IDSEPLQRFIELARCFPFGSAVDLGHEESLVAISITQCFSYTSFAGAIVIVPAVVEEVHAAVESGADNTNCNLLIDVFQTEVPAFDADGRHLLSGASKISVDHDLSLLCLT